MMKQNTNRDLILNGPIIPTMLKLSWPIIVAHFMHTLYGITDAFWLGKVPGNVAVAAPGLVWTIIFLIISFAIGMGVAGTSLVAQFFGAGKDCEAKLFGGQIFSLLTIISIILSTIGFFMAKYIPFWMGAQGKFAQYSGAYLKIIFIGMPFHFLLFAYSAWKRGIGDSVSPMKLLSGSILANMILDPIAIMPLALNWIQTSNNEYYAVIGAALATILSRIIFGIIAVAKILKEQDRHMRFSPEDFIPNPKIMMKIVQMGVPASFGQAGTAMGFVIMNSIVVSFDAPGTTMVFTTFFVATRILSLFFMPAIGIAQAVAMFTGQNIGAEQPERAKDGYWMANLLSVTLIVFFTITTFIFAPQFIAIFKNDPTVIKLGTRCMRIIVMSLPFFPLMQNSMGLHQGTGHTTLGMLISLSRLWFMRLPLVYFFKHFNAFPQNPPDAIWYAMAISNVFGGLLGVFIFSRGHWRKRTIKKDENSEIDFCDT